MLYTHTCLVHSRFCFANLSCLDLKVISFSRGIEPFDIRYLATIHFLDLCFLSYPFTTFWDCLCACPQLAYADDLKIFTLIFSVADVSFLQDNLNIIIRRYHGMKLNTDKCYCLKFSRQLTPVSSSYPINGQPLFKVDFRKDLGVHFDSNLRFIDHIQIISSSACKSFGFIICTF